MSGSKVTMTVAEEMAELTEKSIEKRNKEANEYTIQSYPKVLEYIKRQCTHRKRYAKTDGIMCSLLNDSRLHFKINLNLLVSMLKKDGFNVKQIGEDSNDEKNTSFMVTW